MGSGSPVIHQSAASHRERGQVAVLAGRSPHIEAHRDVGNDIENRCHYEDFNQEEPAVTQRVAPALQHQRAHQHEWTNRADERERNDLGEQIVRA